MQNQSNFFYFSGVDVANNIFGDMIKTVMTGTQAIKNCANLERTIDLWYDIETKYYSRIFFLDTLSFGLGS